MTTKRAAGARTPAKKAAARKAPPTTEQRLAKLERDYKKLQGEHKVTTWLLAELWQKLREAAVQQLLANPQVQQALAARAMAAQVQQPGQPGATGPHAINPLLAQLLGQNGQQ